MKQAIVGALILCGGIFSGARAADSVQVHTTAHFAIYWFTSGPNAPVSRDSDGNGRPDYVDTAAANLEATYKMLADSLHYRKPRAQSTTFYTKRDVPDGLYPVEILDLATADPYWKKTGTYGTILDSLEYLNGHGGTSIWLENNFLDNEKDSIVVGIRGVRYRNWVLEPYMALKFAAAHELYHAFTYEYEYDWLYAFHEMAAVWFESWYAPETRNHWRYLPLFRDNLGMGAFNNAAQQGYGNYLYLKAMVDLYGPHVIRKLWEDRAANSAGNDDQIWFKAAWGRLKIDTISRLTRYYGENAVRLITGQSGAFDDGGKLVGLINPAITNAQFLPMDTTRGMAWGSPAGMFAISPYGLTQSGLGAPNWNIVVAAANPENGGDMYVVHYPSKKMDIIPSIDREAVVQFSPTDTMLVFVNVAGDKSGGWVFYGTTRAPIGVHRRTEFLKPAYTRSLDILGRSLPAIGTNQIHIDRTSDGEGSRRRFGR